MFWFDFLQFPRVVYFTLYCLGICLVYYEYEAVHTGFPHIPASSKVKNNNTMDGSIKTTDSNSELVKETPNERERTHTAGFLMLMSYLIYSSGSLFFLLNKTKKHIILLLSFLFFAKKLPWKLKSGITPNFERKTDLIRPA